MTATRKKYKIKRWCENETCDQYFFTMNGKRKYCSDDCRDEQQARIKIGEPDNDPTPEEIAEICRRIRSGELVIHSSLQRIDQPRVRVNPSWCAAKVAAPTIEIAAGCGECGRVIGHRRACSKNRGRKYLSQEKRREPQNGEND